LRRLLTTAKRGESPWAVLGVRRGESLEECKAAFRRLALTLHPDVSQNGADAERFAAVVEAYEDIRYGAADGRRRPPLLRGVRSVGGVLKVSIDELRRDPAYAVHTVLLALDRPAAESPDTSAVASAITSADGHGAAWGGGAAASALGTERIHLLHAYSVRPYILI